LPTYEKLAYLECPTGIAGDMCLERSLMSVFPRYLIESSKAGYSARVCYGQNPFIAMVN